MIKDFWEKGHVTYKNPEKWHYKKNIKKAFYDEFFALSIEKSIKKFKKPVLIVHGTEDEAIPLEEAENLFKMANRPKKLVIIKGANHGFKKRNHWKKLTKEIEKFAK
jgi:dipeptidyl aminopeptidase/acylaminoacyl peptidase